MLRTHILVHGNRRLADEMESLLGEEHRVLPVESIDRLEPLLREQPVEAVFTRLAADTLRGTTAGRYLSSLTDTVKHAPVVGLVESDCPPALKRLAGRMLSDVMPLPLQGDALARKFARGENLADQLDDFWRTRPHRELHGATRSMVTFTPSMFPMIDDLRVAARHDVTTLLIGETGSGKTFTARLIHELSPRRDERFCTVSCGALPADLIESELFGYTKGAFTGADRDKEGKFAAAGRGTLLLDEIDVLPLDQQAKLLRVIETGEYEPVGCNDTRISQARLIVASNVSLEGLTHQGRFRSDLYYRLNILHLRIPPLRERPWDVEYLARKFALQHSRTHGIQLREIEPAFLEALRHYPWPGNVREMENVVRRAVLYSQRGTLTAGDLTSEVRAAASGRAGLAAPVPSPPGARDVDRADGAAGTGYAHRAERTGRRHGFAVPGHARSASHGAPATSLGPVAPAAGGEPWSPQHQTAVAEPPTLERQMGMYEQQVIEESLFRNNLCRKQTAAELGISRVTLYNKMKKFGLLERR